MASGTTPIQELNQALSGMVKDLTEAEVVTIQKKLTFDLLAGFIKRTPVDEGRARGGWQVGVNDPPPVKASAVKEKGTVGSFEGSTFQSGISKLGELGPFQIVYITNNVGYIIVLDQGLFDPADPPEDEQHRKHRASSRSDARKEQAKSLYGHPGASFVSGGFSKQSPGGMVDLTIASVRSSL